MSTQNSNERRLSVAFLERIDLASVKVGGQALSTNDDFFAPMSDLLKAEPAVFIPGRYTENGKWMDGWESRRKRGIGPGNDHDWCIVRLGIPGRIHGVNIDTAHFTGNYPEYAALDACTSSGPPGPDAPWKEIVAKSKLLGGTENLFAVASTERWTHVRLRIFPDGGVARLRVHGEVLADAETLKPGADLAAAAHGGVVIACNDNYFGPKDNLIFPGRAQHMGEGWETQRKRGPGSDWIVVRLAATGTVSKIEVDTNHYKGNFPESCSIEGCRYPARNLIAADLRDRTDLKWEEILPRVKLQAHHQHFYEKELKGATAGFDYIRLNIYPDGGISRLRVHGNVTR